MLAATRVKARSMPDPAVNPAEEAARRSWAKLEQALDTGTSFVFEAGAGAGKTYSLLQTLDHLIPRHARKYLRRRQQIACITYTRVRSEEHTSEIQSLMRISYAVFCL